LTLASQIITDAYRESNLIPLNGTPSTAQVTEGLSRLNNILLSTIGNEVGTDLKDFNVGGPYDQSVDFSYWLPTNSRLVCNTTAAVTLYLDPSPTEGQRLAIVDTLGTLPTYPVTLNGNGRQIEGASSLLLNDDYMTREWIYRADTGNWVRIATLVAADQLPFPPEFDDYFQLRLALRLNPMYGQTLSPEQVASLKQGRRNIRSRYRNRKSIFPDYVGRLGERASLFGDTSDVNFRNE
jgi:hypothetical protein